MALNIVPSWVSEISKDVKLKLDALRDATVVKITENPEDTAGWESRFNTIVSNLNSYKSVDRTSTWGQLTLSIASYKKVTYSENISSPLFEQMKVDNFIDFNGLSDAIAALNMTTLSWANLESLATLIEGAEADETSKISTFTTQVNTEIQKITTDKLLKQPDVLNTITSTLGLDKAYEQFGIL